MARKRDTDTEEVKLTRITRAIKSVVLIKLVIKLILGLILLAVVLVMTLSDNEVTDDELMRLKRLLMTF